MNSLSQYIIEKFKISKDIDINGDGYIHDEITNDFRKLYKIISKEFGKDHPVLDSLVAMSDFDEDDNFYYKFSDNGWFSFLRDVVNYDWICLGRNGAIDVNNSNHKDIAKIIKKWNKLDIGKKVWESF